MKKLITQKSLTCGTGWDIGRLDANQNFYVSPKGLYKRMLYKIRLEPTIETERALASQFGYSDKELSTLLNGGVEPILSRSKKSLTYDEAILRRQELLDAFEMEQEMQSLKSNLAGELAPIEIFANGSTADSGFDLIYDLNIIQYLLFGGQLESPTPGPGGSGGGSQTNQNQTAGADTNEPANNNEEAEANRTETESNSNNERNQNQSENFPQPRPQPLAPIENEEEVTINPTLDGSQNQLTARQTPPLDASYCTAESQILTKAVNDYQAKQSEEQKKDTEQGKTETSAQTDLDNSKRIPAFGEKKSTPDKKIKPISRDNDNDNNNNNENSRELSEGFLDQDTKPAPAGDYSKLPPLCGDKPITEGTISYCIKFEKGAKVTYKKEENCIYCHIQHIKKTLKETTDYNLFPSKITGNLFEEPSCKNTKAVEGISLNIWTIAKPFMPAIKPDIIKDIKAKDTIDKFAFALQDIIVKPFTLPLEKLIAEEITVEAPPQADFKDLSERIQTALRTRKNQIEEDLKILEASSRVDNQANFVKLMEAEMNLMLGYFQSLQNIFSTMYSGTCLGEDKTNGLMNKEQCK